MVTDIYNFPIEGVSKQGYIYFQKEYQEFSGLTVNLMVKIMAMLKIPDDMHEWLKKVQAGFRFKYDKTVSQLEIILHLRPHEIQSEDYDKTIADLHKKLTEHEKEQKNGG